jgi:hypothetical protein
MEPNSCYAYLRIKGAGIGHCPTLWADLEVRYLPCPIEMRRLIRGLKWRSPQRQKDDLRNCEEKEDPVKL